MDKQTVRTWYTSRHKIKQMLTKLSRWDSERQRPSYHRTSYHHRRNLSLRASWWYEEGELWINNSATNTKHIFVIAHS